MRLRLSTIGSSTLLIALAALVFAGASGCGGPGTHGKKMRTEAQGRMNLVNAQINYDQAKQAFNTGQFDKARRELSHAIMRYPDAAQYYVLLGRINLETHQLEAAIEAFNIALSKKPDFAEPHYFIGIIYQRWSDDQAAYRHYAKAFELEPSTAQFLLAAAESLVALGDFDRASVLLQSKMNYFEHNAALRQLQGQIALLQGDPKRAAALFGEARLLNPDDDVLLEELMWAQYTAGMHGQCLETVKRLQDRSREPRSDLLHLEARALAMLDRSNESREKYMELSRMRPSDPIVWSELGLLAWELGDYRRVASCSVQLLALAPERYEGYLLRALNERQKGNVKQAAELFAQAAQRSSTVALPHLLLGQTLEQLGGPANASAAATAYHNALRADPKSAEAAELLRRLTTNSASGAGERVTVVPTP